MTYFRLFVACLLGLGAVAARAGEQPDPGPTSLLTNWAETTEATAGEFELPLPQKKPSTPPRPQKKPIALLSSRVVEAAAPAALIEPGAASLQRGVFIQLASMSSSAAASRRWRKLQKSHPRLLADFNLTLEPANLGDQHLRYRVQVGPLPNRATARDLCWQLKAEQQDCIVIGP